MNTEAKFVDAIASAVASDTPQQAVEQTLKDALAAWGGPPPWTGAPYSAGFDVLHKGDDFTIMHIVWPPHMITEPHNHNMWATIALYQGREDNMVWRQNSADPRDGIVPASGHSVAAGDVFSLDEDAIHSVYNPVEGYTAAIHVYGGDFLGTPKTEWDPEFHQPRPRDLARTGAAFKAADKRG